MAIILLLIVKMQRFISIDCNKNNTIMFNLMNSKNYLNSFLETFKINTNLFH